MVDAIVFELEDADVAIRRCAGEEAACLVGRPGDNVDRGLVQREVVDSLPLAVLGTLFLPDKDLAIVTGRCQDITILGVCPGDAPYSTFVTKRDVILVTVLSER